MVSRAVVVCEYQAQHAREHHDLPREAMIRFSAALPCSLVYERCTKVHNLKLKTVSPRVPNLMRIMWLQSRILLLGVLEVQLAGSRQFLWALKSNAEPCDFESGGPPFVQGRLSDVQQRPNRADDHAQ